VQLITKGAASSTPAVDLTQRIQVELTDLVDATKFHVRILADTVIGKIEAAMAKFSPESAEELEKPIRKGTICAALYNEDGNWYRAKISRSLGKGMVEVEFIDYGNMETVQSDDLRKLPTDLLAFEPQAKLCTLAYIRAPKIDKAYGKEAAEFLQNKALEKVSEAIIVDQWREQSSLVLFEKGEKDWNHSINATLVYEGLASMDASAEEVPREVEEWFNFEAEAKEEQVKIWQYGGAIYDSD